MSYDEFKNLTADEKLEFFKKHRHLGMDHPIMALDGNTTLTLNDLMNEIFP
jgi:hypothetical protein